MLQALLWDVDGTLAETERDGHRVAFNHAFEALGLSWRWDETRYGELLRVTGGRERLLADMATRADAPVPADEREALARELHRRKNDFYAELMHDGGIALRDGVRAVIEAAAVRGLRQGIVTTTSRVNVDALLGHHFGPRWADRFAVIVSGEDVAAKKPSPECYRAALAALHLEPLAALAIEDSCSGATAARAADVPVVVMRSACFVGDVIDQALAIGPGLHTRQGWQPVPAVRDDEKAITFDDLSDWHARMEWVGAHG